MAKHRPIWRVKRLWVAIAFVLAANMIVFSNTLGPWDPWFPCGDESYAHRTLRRFSLAEPSEFDEVCTDTLAPIWSDLKFRAIGSAIIGTFVILAITSLKAIVAQAFGSSEGAKT